MKVLIFEPDHGGHRYTYIRHLLTGLKPLDGIESITLVISKVGRDSDEYKAQLESIAENIDIKPELEIPSGSQLRKGWPW